jgi:hypothetical protein
MFLVVVLVVFVVEAALVVVGLFLWQVAPLQNPVIAPLMHGTPLFLKMLSQVMLAEHLGLLWHGPILLAQIWLTLLKVHSPKVPGALQQSPPSQASAPFLMRSPHLVAWVTVPVNDPVMELVRVMVAEKEVLIVAELVSVMDMVPVLVTVRVPVPVPVMV